MRCFLPGMRCFLHDMRCFLYGMRWLFHYMWCLIHYMRYFLYDMRWLFYYVRCFLHYMRCIRHYMRWVMQHYDQEASFSGFLCAKSYGVENRPRLFSVIWPPHGACSEKVELFAILDAFTRACVSAALALSRLADLWLVFLEIQLRSFDWTFSDLKWGGWSNGTKNQPPPPPPPKKKKKS